MEGEQDWARITELVESGHTEHCAKRQVWGDGECECPGDGTGSPYHTMTHPRAAGSGRRSRCPSALGSRW